MVPTIRKEAPTRKAPMGATPHKAVTNRFPQTGGTKVPRVIFEPTIRDEGMETPPRNDSLKASLSPPVGGHLCSFRRDWQTNKCSCNVITNGYVLPFILKPKLDLIQSGYKVLQKDQALATCIQYLLSKNAIARVKNIKSLGFYSRLFLVNRASPKVEACNRLKQAQHFTSHRKVQNGNSRVHQDIPGSWGMGIVDRYIRRLPSHPHPPKLKEIPKVLPQVTGVPVHLSSFWPSHSPQVFKRIVKEVKLMALTGDSDFTNTWTTG